ncbi:exodeoxyribonuclease VII [Fervidobacterium thailandense]|uniref:Exodeoxyribonuclease VII n=1 Tax=Fervidobacterium thailandense TaxID=1008305 RepID=A0A1E3G5D8_9BACT|nr:exodeoxyribonuclease VII [Fervidobacterium thailandense]ODN31063.1 exodeoxyribonuclease VII [Fervidobacterium thailandense]
MDLEKIKSLTSEEVEKLSFKELMESIETIKSAFLSAELDIEEQIELYSKAIMLLMKAREKLANVRKQKEEIDRMYEEFINRMG